MASNKRQIAQEIVFLMTRGGAYSGLWTGEPMTADEVIAQVEQKGFLPMLDGHTKNSLEMQNTRKKIIRRVVQLEK